MNKPHKHAEVIKAWADGAEIEFRDPLSSGPAWKDTPHPAWHEDWEYRVKPQPKKYKVDVWLLFKHNGSFFSMYVTSPPPEDIYDCYHVIHHTLEGELPNE